MALPRKTELSALSVSTTQTAKDNYTGKSLGFQFLLYHILRPQGSY